MPKNVSPIVFPDSSAQSKAALSPTVGRIKLSTDWVVGIPGVAHWASSTTTNAFPTANTIYYQPMVFSRSWTADQISVRVIASASSATIRLGIYNADMDFMPTSLLVDGLTVDSSSVGTKTATLSLGTQPAGNYLLAVLPTNTQTMLIWRGGGEWSQLNPDLTSANPYPYSLRASSLASAGFPSTGPTPTLVYNTVPYGHYGFLRYSFV